MAVVIVGVGVSGTAVGQPVPDSVYAPPDLPAADAGVTDGLDGALGGRGAGDAAAHFALGVSTFTDYVYRGVEVFETPAAGDGPDLQIDAKASVAFGKLPRPYVSVFVDVADSDPVSDVQEIRPAVGVDWPVKPLVFGGGYVTYLYPERDERQTSEVFVGVALDDTLLVRGGPVPSPYVTAAYDFDSYQGVYVEAGVRYRFAVEETGLTLTASAEVAYVAGFAATVDGDDGATERGFFSTARTDGETVDGFQHYQAGLVADYSLNRLFDVPARYGELALHGSVYYTDGLSDDVGATTRVWGGVGVSLSY